MKIYMDKEELCNITDKKKKVLCSYIHEDEFDFVISESIKYIVNNQYEQCLKKLREEWEPKLKIKGVKMFPVDDEDFSALVFEQADYQTRKERDPKHIVNVPTKKEVLKKTVVDKQK